jgi:hypothetical protein
LDQAELAVLLDIIKKIKQDTNWLILEANPEIVLEDTKIVLQDGGGSEEAQGRRCSAACYTQIG